MADEPAIDPAAAPAPEADVTPEAQVDAPPATTESDEDPFAPVADAEPDTFPRDYVERLRREGAKYRTTAKERAEALERLKPLGSAFEGLEPDEVEGWTQFISEAKNDPEAALSALMRNAYGLDREGALEVLDAIFEAGEEQPGAAPDPENADDLDRPLTLRDLQRIEQERAQEAEQAQALEAVKKDARELGYDPDAEVGSQAEARYHRLLHLAAKVHGNDLQKAHDALVAEEQALVQSYLSKKEQEADSLPTPSGSGGSAAAPDGGTPSWEDARRNAAEFVRAQVGSPV